jgi:hypothetical protein
VWAQARTVRAETSIRRSASKSRTSAADRRYRKYQRTAVVITSSGQRYPAKGVPVRSVNVRRQAPHRKR